VDVKTLIAILETMPPSALVELSYDMGYGTGDVTTVKFNALRESVVLCTDEDEE
jgi:hypothetical protein